MLNSCCILKIRGVYPNFKKKNSTPKFLPTRVWIRILPEPYRYLPIQYL